MEIRDYTPADNAALIALCAEMERHWSGDEAPAADIQAARIDHALATLGDMVVLIAEREREGMLTASPTWPGASLTLSWWVSGVSVSAAPRGAGVGRALMCHVLDLALTGAPEGTRVDIITDHDNTPAAQLYPAIGGADTPKLYRRYHAAARQPEEASHV